MKKIHIKKSVKFFFLTYAFCLRYNNNVELCVHSHARVKHRAANTFYSEQ